MSDKMQSTEKADTRTVTICAEIWHALLEIAGRQIDPETAEVCSLHRQLIDRIGRLDFARAPGTGCGSNLEI
jgi:hypothetical protein